MQCKDKSKKSLFFRDKKGNHKPRAKFIYTNCVCPEKNKILNFSTYCDQVFGQSLEGSSVILISEDDKKNFKTFFENPDPQPALRRKKQPKEPLVLEKPKTLPPKRVRPSLNYSVINEENYLVQPDNPTNVIQTKAIETGIILLIN